MTKTEPLSKRTPSLDTAERMRNRVLVAPFIRQIGRWQERTAHLGGFLQAGRMDHSQYLSAALELYELAGEVETTRDLFIKSTLDKDQWSRVRDVRMALEQLARRIQHLSVRLAAGQPNGEPFAAHFAKPPSPLGE